MVLQSYLPQKQISLLYVQGVLTVAFQIRSWYYINSLFGADDKAKTSIDLTKDNIPHKLRNNIDQQYIEMNVYKCFVILLCCFVAIW